MTSPVRRLLRGLRGPSGPAILMYHRVASPPIDPWGLAVAPERFRDQLTVLARWRTILAMEEFVAELAAGRLPQRAVAITFDDGYRDNLTNAVPLLDEFAAPATVFLTASAIGRKAPFWWDELARMILLQAGPIRYDLVVGTDRVTGDIATMASGETPDRHWRAWEAPRTAREAAYQALWRLLQRSQPSVRAAVMDGLRQAVPPVIADPDGVPMSAGEVARMVSFNVSIGSHAMSHQPLTSLSRADRRTEIEEGRAFCMGLVDQPVNGFAFPHGDRDDETLAMVREAGFAWACSTRAARVDPNRYNRFDLPRIVAPDIAGGEILERIEAAAP